MPIEVRLKGDFMKLQRIMNQRENFSGKNVYV